MGHSQVFSSMAKFLVILAWAGLCSSAPQFSRNNNNDLVTRVISALNILDAVTAALRGQTSTSLSSSNRASSSSSYGSGSAVGEWSQWTTVSSPVVSTVNRFPTAQIANTRTRSNINSRRQSSNSQKSIVSGVLTALSPQIQRAVADALRSTTTTTTTAAAAVVRDTPPAYVTAPAQVSTSSMVQQIISILTPTIRQSVSQALAGQSVSQQSFTSNYATSTQTINRESVTMKVLDALEPTIAAQVSSAIETMRANQIARLQQQLTVSESESESLVQQIIITLTPTIRSAVRRALDTQVQQQVSVLASKTTQVDQTSLVKQILSILRPQVMTAVSDAVDAQEAAEARRQAALREQQRQAALREQQRQAALREQQRLEAGRQQQRLEAERQAALLAAQQQSVGGDLVSVFGHGHEVSAVVPGQSRVEYHIGLGKNVAAVRPAFG